MKKLGVFLLVAFLLVSSMQLYSAGEQEKEVKKRLRALGYLD